MTKNIVKTTDRKQLTKIVETTVYAVISYSIITWSFIKKVIGSFKYILVKEHILSIEEILEFLIHKRTLTIIQFFVLFLATLSKSFQKAFRDAQILFTIDSVIESGYLFLKNYRVNGVLR